MVSFGEFVSVRVVVDASLWATTARVVAEVQAPVYSAATVSMTVVSSTSVVVTVLSSETWVWMKLCGI